MKLCIGLFTILIGSCIRIASFDEPSRLPPTSPRITRLIARPRIIHAGERVVLTWNSRNTKDVLLEEAKDASAGAPAEYLHEVGKFPANGTHEVRPNATTRYVISCGDEKIGCASASVTVLVK